MAQVTIEIPDFEFSGFYYPELFVALRQLTRINVPEITDESDEEPYTQLISSFALIGHLNNVLLDITANETLLPTARLLESVRSQLKLIDVRLSQATPAVTDVLYEFSKVFTTPTLIVPSGTQTATEQEAENGEITFEALTDNLVQPSNAPSKVFVFSSGFIEVKDNAFDGGDSITIAGVTLTFGVEIAIGADEEDTAENIRVAIASSTDPAILGVILPTRAGALVSLLPVNSTVTTFVVVETDNATDNLEVRSLSYSTDLSGTFSTAALLASLFPVDPRPHDAVYIMHENLEWNQFDFEFDTPGSGIFDVLEFFDGVFDDAIPNTVTNLGPNLKLVIDDLLSPGDQVPLDRRGARVRVILNSTGAFEDVISEYDEVLNQNFVTTVGLLGQAIVSTDEDDYTVGSAWNPVVNENDETIGFSEDGLIEYDLPDNLTQNWQKTTVNGFEGFFLRFRINRVSGRKAAGSLDFIASGVGVAIEDGDTVTISDGAGNTDTYEFDVGGGGVTLGNIAVVINASDTATAIKAAFLLAVVGGTAAVTYVSGVGNLVTIENDVIGIAGNVAIVESISNSQTLTPVGMTGGENLPVVPIVDILRIDQGDQFLKTSQTQGETKQEDPLASSNGTPSQIITLTFQPLIEGSLVIEVDEGAGFTAYNQVDNFLNSGPSSKDYVLEITADDVATVTFGDGTQGKVPPLGVDNIRATYRTGAEVNGNVGSNTIIVNKSGIAFVRRVFNPRQAIGWVAKEGSTEADLARLKIEGPASLRTRNRGVTTDDFEFLSRQFEASTGSKVVERAEAIEESFGVKTIELIVAGFGGQFLTDALRTEIEDFFNGNKSLGIEGVGLANHEVTVVNFIPKTIDVTIEIITVLTEVAPFENAIQSLLSPSAKLDDGVTFRWDFGALVPRAIIIAEMFKVNETEVKNVILTLPAADVQLDSKELPVVGNILVTLTPPS